MSCQIHPNLILGYACLNETLRKQNIFSSRTCRLQTLKKKAIEEKNGDLKFLHSLVKRNLIDLIKILKWNKQHGILFFRMSSEIFPFFTHPDYFSKISLKTYKNILEKIGKFVNSEPKIRLTFHPNQFCQLTSLRKDVIDNTIRELNFHASVLDLMNLNADSVIVIHGGTKKGGLNNALERFHNNFSLLNNSAKQRLVIENCEFSFNIESLLPLSFELKIPIIIDFHHHKLYPSQTSLDLLIPQVISIWNERGINIKFHLSESKNNISENDSITKKRAHSDYITHIPKCLLDLAEKQKIYVMLECKKKELALFYLNKKLKK